MLIGTILLVFLILILLGALPRWGYSSGWGMGHQELLVLLLIGRVPFLVFFIYLGKRESNMKGIINLVVGGFFVITASTSMAATKTDPHSQWICTTNASNSSVDSDKKADDKMAQTKSSANSAFAFASTNCRDCTKITCEVQAK